MQNLYFAFNKIIKIILNSKFTLFLPSKQKIIVIDKQVFDVFKNIFEKKFYFLPKRKEEFNLILVVLSIIHWIRNRDKSIYQEYLLLCIKFINPKIIIFSFSSDTFVLSLKKYFNDKTIICFQETCISKETFYNLKFQFQKKKINIEKNKIKIDYIFCVGRYSKINLKKIIDGKFYTSGSLNNNHFFKKRKIDKDSLIFISQFGLKERLDLEKKTGINFLKCEKTFFRHIIEYCKKNDLRLKVLSKSYGVEKKEFYDQARKNELFFNRKKFYFYEKKLFDKIIGKKNYQYIDRSDNNSSYKIGQKYLFFITYSSTLGVELLAIGKKVGFFPFEEIFRKIYNWQYLNTSHKNIFYFWENKKKGFNWSDSYSKEEIFRVLKNVMKKKHKQSKLNNQVVFFDKKNVLIKDFFKKKFNVIL